MITSDAPDISIVIPAYNEEQRLPCFLEEVVSFAVKSVYSYEIIVVDDGSKDRTVALAREVANQHKGIYVVVNERNRGKGYSVKCGLLKACGNVRVFLDADGSVHPAEIERVLPLLENGFEAVIGSRVLRSGKQVLKRRWFRVLMGSFFNFTVKKLLALPFKDTQCGFKVFKAHVVEAVVPKLRLERFGFDLELLTLIHKRGYRTLEVPVSWIHKHGSKVNLITDSFAMFINVLQIRQWYG